MRLLKALVIFMAVVLVIGFAVVGVELVRRMIEVKEEAQTAATQSPPSIPGRSEPAAPVPPPSPAELPAFGEASLALPEGAQPIDVAAAGDRVILRVMLPDQSQRLLVLNLRDGSLLGTVLLEVPSDGKPKVPEVVVPPRNRSEGLR